MLVMFLLINLREWIFLKLNIIDFFVASFFGLYLLSIAFSEIGIQQKFENLFFFFTSVATAYVCGKLFSIEDLQKLWNLFANFCAILVLLTTLDLLFFQTNDMRFQFFGLGHSPLILAYIFTFFLSLHTAFLLNKNFSTSVFELNFAVNLMSFSVCIFFTVVFGARGWLLALILGIFGSVLTFSKSSKSNKVFYLAFFASNVCLFLYFSSAVLGQANIYKYTVEVAPSFGEIVKLIYNGEGCSVFSTNNSIAWRLQYYYEALIAFMNNPFFGIGIGGFEELSCAPWSAFPHSTILQAFAEMGLLGGGSLVACFCAALLHLLRYSRINMDPKGKVLTQVGGLLFIGIIADQFYGNLSLNLITWFALGIVSALSQRLWEDRTA
jgi:O-antigen ligase